MLFSLNLGGEGSLHKVDRVSVLCLSSLSWMGSSMLIRTFCRRLHYLLGLVWGEDWAFDASSQVRDTWIHWRDDFEEAFWVVRKKETLFIFTFWYVICILANTKLYRRSCYPQNSGHGGCQPESYNRRSVQHPLSARPTSQSSSPPIPFH